MAFHAEGSLRKFVGVKVDDNMVDPSCYTAEAGSVIVTLNEDYLNTLSLGKHTLTVVYTDGEAVTSFEIVESFEDGSGSEGGSESGSGSESDTGSGNDTGSSGGSASGSGSGNSSSNTQAPTTGDRNHLGFWTVMLCISGSVMIMMKKKKQ